MIGWKYSGDESHRIGEPDQTSSSSMFNSINLFRFYRQLPSSSKAPYSFLKKRSLGQSGVTLVEIMISMTIIGLLTILIMTGVKDVQKRAKIQHCQNNLREIGMAFDCYASLWEGWLLPTAGPEDDDLSPFYPYCANRFKAFVCISTANQVSTVEDLKDNAQGGSSGAAGHSYEYLGYYLFDKDGFELNTPIKKSRSSVDLRAEVIILAMDAMEAGIPRFPDILDNHDDAGGNVLFADSHVEWIPHGTWDLIFQRGNSLKIEVED